MSLSRALIILGLVLVVAGVAVHFGRNIPWLGRLPGDIRVERPGFTFYFPVMTSLVLSIILSLVLYLFSRRQ